VASSIEQWLGNGKGVLGTAAANAFNFAALSSKVGLPFVDAGAGNDSLVGSNFSDDFRGNAGNDTLQGLAGIDLLTGGTGRDMLMGGAHNDIFDFNAPAESLVGGNRDRILDFNRGQGDKIDLSTIDADIRGTPGNQKFTFIGAAAFTHHDGELRFSSHVLQGDVNGDGRADFEIFVNAASLLKTDFML
jgi:Ca2+-binding RTX toxin-like protein